MFTEIKGMSMTERKIHWEGVAIITTMPLHSTKAGY